MNIKDLMRTVAPVSLTAPQAQQTAFPHAEMATRFFDNFWGTEKKLISLGDGRDVFCVSVGPMSHHDSYLIESAGEGPFVVTKDSPWYGRISGGKATIVPTAWMDGQDVADILAIDSGWTSPADLIFWHKPPANPPQTRAPIRRSKYNIGNPTTSIVINTGGRLFLRYYVDHVSDAGTVAVTLHAASFLTPETPGADLPSVPIRFVSLPTYGAVTDTIAANKALYKEVSLSAHGVSGADIIRLEVDATEDVERFTVEAFD